jgi:hypothetical protein
MEIALGQSYRNTPAGFEVRVIETSWIGGVQPPAHRFGLEVRPDREQVWQRRLNGLSWPEAAEQLTRFLMYQALPAWPGARG